MCVPRLVSNCLPVLFLAIVAVAAVASLKKLDRRMTAVAHVKQNQIQQVLPPLEFAINQAELDRHVIRALDALGNRFDSLTQGRSIVTATLTHPDQSRAIQLTITRELPDKLRIDETSLTTKRTYGYDGSRSWTNSGSPSAEDSLFIEMMLRDSVEHFIAGQARGNATLPLGDMFRTDDGSTENYDGPFYDILRVDDTFTTTQGIQSRPTLFYLNSRTGLPEKIVYERQGDSAARIEVEFADWITIANQKTPGRIIWKENEKVTSQLTITQVAFVPIVQDGIFNAPQGL